MDKYPHIRTVIKCDQMCVCRRKAKTRMRLRVRSVIRAFAFSMLIALFLADYFLITSHLFLNISPLELFSLPMDSFMTK